MKTLKSLATPIRAVSRLALVGAVIATATEAALAQTPILLRTFDNPNPANGDYFGAAIAALGNDRILIGAPGDDATATNAGIVYLFHTNGTLLTTITNPPAITGGFGASISALGSDRVVIGSVYGGSVHLFATNGVWLTNISGQSGHVSAVAWVGNDKLLIGDHWADEESQTYATFGAAYLCSTNGALLTTFNNLNPGPVIELGSSVAAFGSDRILIGANTVWPNSGAAYLYHTNGALLMTFMNPAPSAYSSIAAVGTDRVLVGSQSEGASSGAVYVFNTNGALLLTITNPTPTVADSFGYGIAVLGNDRVIIGAPDDDTTGTNSGSAYLFSLNGTLLATINNPSPGVGACFGLRLIPFGNDCVLIGAISQNGDGTVYLFRIPSSATQPTLNIQPTTPNTVLVSWPSTATDFVLQQNTNGLAAVNWSNVTSGIQDDGINKSLSVSPSLGARFYRLFKP